MLAAIVTLKFFNPNFMLGHDLFNPNCTKIIETLKYAQSKSETVTVKR